MQGKWKGFSVDGQYELYCNWLKELTEKERMDEIGRHSKGILDPDFWKPVGYGAVIGAILMMVFLGGYHYAGSSGFCASCHSMKYVHSKWRVSKQCREGALM